MPPITVSTHVEAPTPRQLDNYLGRTGWKFYMEAKREDRPSCHIWKKSFAEIRVPLHEKDFDYYTRLRESVEKIAKEERRDTLDVYNDIVAEDAPGHLAPNDEGKVVRIIRVAKITQELTFESDRDALIYMTTTELPNGQVFI